MSDNGSSEESDVRPPAAETRGGFASGRMSSAAVPLEKSMNFGPSTKRLLRRMGPERSRLALVIVLAVVSVSLVVLGPRVLGHATDLIVSGISGGGIDFTALHQTLFAALGLYVGVGLPGLAAGLHAGRRRAAHDVRAAGRGRGQAQRAATRLRRRPVSR